ncbi:MAG: GNAT family N-acetyltransferase [Acidobacteria bacterium]|nr:GNAT family N-acetyltransferase [Acidobacteriota bacterium]
MEEIRIRIAEEKDARAMIEFNQAMAFETEGRKLDPDKISGGVRAVFDGSERAFYVVAETSESEIIGGLMVTKEWSDWRNGWFWWIQSVYILPEGRGKKIYSRMYDFVKERAKAMGGVCGFRLYVEKDNSHAQKVYESLGMIETDYLMYEEEV